MTLLRAQAAIPEPDGPADRAPRPPRPRDRRAEDFFAPVLFALIARVRHTFARLSAAGAVSGGDPEAIHDFRVALRRLRTALFPARHLFGKRHVRALGAELKRIAQLTGALRDEEVLSETLTALALPPRARAELSRWVARSTLGLPQRRQDLVRRLLDPTALASAVAPGSAATPDAPPSVRAVLARLERRVGDRRMRELGATEFAEAAFEGALSDVRELVRQRACDAAGLHALRIRFKRLRYLAELFDPVLGERAERAAKLSARMQKRLGGIHDLDETLARIARARSLSKPTHAAARRALVRARMTSFGRARRELQHDLQPLLQETTRSP